MTIIFIDVSELGVKHVTFSSSCFFWKSISFIEDSINKNKSFTNFTKWPFFLTDRERWAKLKYFFLYISQNIFRYVRTLDNDSFFPPNPSSMMQQFSWPFNTMRTLYLFYILHTYVSLV